MNIYLNCIVFFLLIYRSPKKVIFCLPDTYRKIIYFEKQMEDVETKTQYDIIYNNIKQVMDKNTLLQKQLEDWDVLEDAKKHVTAIAISNPKHEDDNDDDDEDEEMKTKDNDEDNDNDDDNDTEMKTKENKSNENKLKENKSNKNKLKQNKSNDEFIKGTESEEEKIFQKIREGEVNNIYIELSTSATSNSSSSYDNIDLNTKDNVDLNENKPLKRKQKGVKNKITSSGKKKKNKNKNEGKGKNKKGKKTKDKKTKEKKTGIINNDNNNNNKNNKNNNAEGICDKKISINKFKKLYKTKGSGGGKLSFIFNSKLKKQSSNNYSRNVCGGYLTDIEQSSLIKSGINLKQIFIENKRCGWGIKKKLFEKKHSKMSGCEIQYRKYMLRKELENIKKNTVSYFGDWIDCDNFTYNEVMLFFTKFDKRFNWNLLLTTWKIGRSINSYVLFYFHLIYFHLIYFLFFYFHFIYRILS